MAHFRARWKGIFKHPEATVNVIHSKCTRRRVWLRQESQGGGAD